MLSPRRALGGAALLGCLPLTAPALAHIDLLEPAPRAPGQPDTTLSRGPCGQRQNGRLDDEVHVFRPGESIDVVWEVYVQHVSYFRLALDADGDDSFSARRSMPSDPVADDPTLLPPGEGEIILDYIEDRTGDIDRVERRVTLPDVECERCTLQLIQFTYGLPIDEATYHQCADLVLDDGDGVFETGSGASAARATPSLGAGDPDDVDAGSSCSLARGATARGESLGWLVGALAWAARRACRSTRRARCRSV
jgi:hypothetical protein